jgi:arylsulfatase A
MTPPNIVFILVDDMGYGDFAAFNGGLTCTPALDALMAESVCLTQQYTASPVCNPSRACLLTGRYPHRTGSIDTLEWRGLERLALRERTLADMLKARGYATGLVGKWHLGAFDPRYKPTRRGFDEAVCFRGGMHDYYDWRLEVGEDVVRRGDGRYLTDVWVEEAVAFLERHKDDEPFFLHVTFNAPHTPLQVPEEEYALFADRDDLTWGVKTLYAMIHRMDRGVARILETLDRLGLRENTIVLFTSDNGPQFGGEGDACTDRFNCGFRGAKCTTYEGGIRVPSFVRWPGGGLDGGRVVDRMMHFSDWLPTFLAMTDTPLPADNRPLDGIDMLPTLRGERDDACTKRCWQWNRYTPLVECNAAIRDGDWKLVRPIIWEAIAMPEGHLLHTSMYDYEYFLEHGIIRDGDPPREVPPPPPPELYHLADDPLEAHNVADAHPDVARRLLRDLETWFEEVDAERRTIHDEVPA